MISDRLGLLSSIEESKKSVWRLILIDLSGLGKNLRKGLTASVSSNKRFSGTLIVSTLAFTVSALSTNPGFSLQMLSAGIQYWPTAIYLRTIGILTTTGITGLIMTAIFSLLAGATITNTFIRLKMNKLSFDALGSLPGFLASGCASCGVGVFSLLGMGGILALLPFNGVLLQFGGIVLLLALIALRGDPETCSI